MESSSGMLKIVRGAREVARARGNGNRSSNNNRKKNSVVGHSNPKQKNKRRSRVPGQVGVAVRREDSSRGPLSPSDNRYGERGDHVANITVYSL